MSDIIIEPGALDFAGDLARNTVCAGKAAIISDETVLALYGKRLKRSLEDAGFTVFMYAFPAGEKNKNARTYMDILDFLVSCRFSRSDCVFALGGGVPGDVAGFAAATFLRGVKLVQIPTTIIACVDSSVGGKNGIDLAAGKNLVGTFYQPDLVLIDPELTDSLPDNVFRNGCAEIIKYGVIRDVELFERLPVERSALTEVIRRCVKIKRDITCADERDVGGRRILNFGHSFGHAAELVSGYSLSHGQAVAFGMAVMARACCRRGLCSTDTRDRLIEKIQAFDLPIEIDYSTESVCNAMFSDKKRSGNMMTLVTLHGIGDCRLETVGMGEAQAFLLDGMRP